MVETPSARRRAIVSAIVEARQADDAATFVADPASGSPARVTYDDRTLRLEVDATERDRLADLLAEYHVFKLEQPATRKADDGVVYLSAVTDPKHAADFVEALFREVYDAPEAYRLRVE